MKLFDDTDGDVLKNNPEMCKKLDGLVEGFTIGLYDYKDEQSKLKEIAYWNGMFTKSTIRFSMPLERCYLRKQSNYTYDNEYEYLIGQPCTQPMKHFMIRYDGQAYFCCEDDQCEFKFGNVFEQSLEEVWWSPKHVRMAMILNKSGGRKMFSTCHNCIMGLTYINLL